MSSNVNVGDAASSEALLEEGYFVAVAIDGIKRRSLLSLRSLVTRMEAHPERITVDIVDAFCFNLDASLIPCNPTPLAVAAGPNTAVSRAELSLAGLTMIPLDPPDELVAPVVAKWPSVFAWMAYFHSIHMNARPPAEIEGVIMGLLGILSGSDLIETLFHTPGLVAMATTIWLKAPSKKADVRLQTSIGFKAILAIATATGGGGAAMDKAMHDEILRCVDGDANKIAELALVPVREASKILTGSEWLLLLHDISILFNLCLGPTHDIRMAVINKRGIPLITALFVRLSSPKNSKSQSPLIRLAISECAKLIEVLITTGGGIPWVKQAILSGLLTGIVNTGAKLSTEFAASESLGGCDSSVAACLHMCETIMAPLVYRSIVDVVEPAFLALDTPETASKLERAPSLGHAWTRLRALVGSRAVLSRSSLCGSQDMGTCEMCNNKLAKDALKRCGGCHYVTYCSKECQREDWKRGHKTGCALDLHIKSKGLNKDDIAPRKRDSSG
ncbi:hypothetical protein FA95DRAFT_91021 [Auriscalpium vulgare]|uniref:Uncharacterized protein n=1 Tax=Auriscalpium vulgare TaxID=40419 RepID=A0ACB8RPC5_9AGAM|nr:hypothetical protein FA95DRAFT_91021 [Auriscalpium vulgare]